MQTINLGKVSLIPRGEYNATTEYKRLDIVTYQGSAYTVLKDVLGITPTDDKTNYLLLVSKGDPYLESSEYKQLTEQLKQSVLNGIQNIDQKTRAFNQNVVSKTNDFNLNAQTKTETFDTNANEKINAYNQNDKTKIKDYNDNALLKEQSYNEKVKAFDSKVIESNTTIDSKVKKATDEADRSKLEADKSALNSELALKIAIKPKTEGNPVVINDSIDYKPLSLLIKGSTNQVTTTGRNLFDISKLSKLPDNQIINNQNGSITVKPPSGSNASSSSKRLNELAVLEVGKTYTLTANSTGKDKYIYLSKSQYTWPFGSARKIVQNDLDSIVYFYANGIGTTALVSEIQIEEGSTANAYEPFSSGKISPSPEYPQSIINATFDKLIITGKNLLNTNNIITNNQSQIRYYSKENPLTLIKGTYTVSNDKTLQEISIKDAETDEYIKRENNIKSITFTLLKDTKCCDFMFSSTDHIVTNDSQQLEIGTSPTSYEPYKGKIIKLSKPIELSKWDRIEIINKGSKYVVETLSYTNTIVVKSTDIRDFEKIVFLFDLPKNAFSKNDAYSSFSKDILIFGENLNTAQIKYNSGENIDFIKRKIDEHNGIQFVYKLAEPMRTSLLEVDVNAIQSIQMYYPNTVLMTNDGVTVDVEYIADSKNYTDNKIAEIKKAVVALGGK